MSKQFVLGLMESGTKRSCCVSWPVHHVHNFFETIKVGKSKVLWQSWHDPAISPLFNRPIKLVQSSLESVFEWQPVIFLVVLKDLLRKRLWFGWKLVENVLLLASSSSGGCCPDGRWPSAVLGRKHMGWNCRWLERAELCGNDRGFADPVEQGMEVQRCTRFMW